MATSLTTKLVLKLQHTFTNALDLSTPEEAFNQDFGDSLANGTGNDQADQVWHDQRTLAAASEDLDLAGSLTNAFGDTVTFVKVRGILIHNTSTTATEALTVGGAAANQFATFVADTSDKIIVGPDGVLLLWTPIDGYAVTAATGDLLKIDAGTDTITYDIYIVGTTA